MKELPLSEESRTTNIKKALDSTYRNIDIFIERLHTKDVELTPNAQSIFRLVNSRKGRQTIKESKSLAVLIGEEIAEYQRIKESESIYYTLINQHEKNLTKSETDLDANLKYISDLNTLSVLRRAKDAVAIDLSDHIEIAYCHNVIAEIGLVKKIKKLEEENVSQKILIADIEKYNRELKKENDELHQILPNFKKDKSEVGEVTS